MQPNLATILTLKLWILMFESVQSEKTECITRLLSGRPGRGAKINSTEFELASPVVSGGQCTNILAVGKGGVMGTGLLG